MQANRVRDAALVVLGSDDPDLAGDLTGNPFEHREARRFDAVVIAEQDAIQHATAPLRTSAPAIRLFPAVP